ncbi:hypothetical protein [Chamaesiphon sp. OTE_75_metabat_556]|uniref:hypothetical protein n=1 Tax=Chamaesiphon sp. OTE_75_metabat_556 TaxID=2964692 RepID=UPI00286B16A9|nr:hypothetical protein [Chamaesiphon sp. OTE_75_metabat_556]
MAVVSLGGTVKQLQIVNKYLSIGGLLDFRDRSSYYLRWLLMVVVPPLAVLNRDRFLVSPDSQTFFNIS